MSRAVLILQGKKERDKATTWIRLAPPGTVVEFRAYKRTTPQNARLHAMISTVAREVLWHGQRLDLDDWKLLFLDALNREVRAAPSLDGRGFVNLGRKTSKLTKDECGQLMDLVEAFAAQRGIDLGEKETAA